MCGIAGIVHFDGAPVDSDLVARMTEAIAHRGPDGHGIWVEGNVGLGHRRLAIRDLSDAARQPMVHADGPIVVTYNGEIYNDQVLRAEISRRSALQFRTSCDTELIAPAYAIWGQDAFERFEGMFALGLWDSVNQRLVLARDAVGIKPLYYSWLGSSLRFASEIKALLTLPDQPRRISTPALHRFLAQGYPGPTSTLVDGILPLPPGSIMIADRSGFRVQRFWHPSRSGEIRDMRMALEEFERLWPRVVRDMLVSDVSVGLLLSGGVDSSLVASALKHVGIRAFTAQFAARDFDESATARSVADSFGIQHVSIPVDATESMEDRFLDVVHHFDGNCADSSAYAFHSVCEAARAHVPVLLTGDGADEFFAGYETYRASRLAGAIPRTLARPLGRLLLSVGPEGSGRIPFREKLARLLLGRAEGGSIPHPQWRRLMFSHVLTAVHGPALSKLMQSSDPLDEYAQAVKAAHARHVVDRCLWADQTYYLPGDLLVKTDAMSMAHGVEVRVPFLDRRIMEFAGRLHSSLLTSVAGPDKHVLRLALERAGASPAMARARKRGFNVPIAGYLRAGLRRLGEHLLVKQADALYPFFNPSAVARLWQEHVSGEANHGYALWTLLTFATWRERTDAN